MAQAQGHQYDTAAAEHVASVAVPAALEQTPGEIALEQRAAYLYAMRILIHAEVAGALAGMREPFGMIGKRGSIVTSPGPLTVGGGLTLRTLSEGRLPDDERIMAHYLAAQRAVRSLVRTSRHGADGVDAIRLDGPGGAQLPGGGKGVPIPVPIPGGALPSGLPSLPGGLPNPLDALPGLLGQGGTPILPGPGGSQLRAFPLGQAAIVIVVLGVAGIVAGTWAYTEVEASREVEVTQRRELEVAAQTKLAQDLATAQIAAGLPVDVPEVIRSLAKAEERSGWGLPVAAGFIGLGLGIIGAGVAAAKLSGGIAT